MIQTLQHQRYNVFNQIHKGLRGMLYDTALRLQQTDFSRPQASLAVEQLKEVLSFLEEHADNEDQFILPHVRTHNAQLIDELEKDHEIDHRLTQTLLDHVQGWSTASPFEQEIFGQRICYAFSEFIAFNLYHMNKEENVLMYLLWTHYTDEEIRQMEGQIIQSIAPQTLLAESRWMMRSINDKEMIEWLTGLKQGAPPAVFDMFLGLAKEELSAERLGSVQAALAVA
ncbi:hemerythrin domain-containing protein [Fibrella forsythiae]|uniref:Hemerythrin domain-containing protein n=1 Tax=Fibrella forsythiae TaxID=2817061 RepID=A0ABS3JS81_9BACT|nr:hemerythrin domain-containing protein [Fibrella forsythiae]MBO0952878.1 hemerythrin domain-containing protein [Fibrella forsythiae]